MHPAAEKPLCFISGEKKPKRKREQKEKKKRKEKDEKKEKKEKKMRDRPFTKSLKKKPCGSWSLPESTEFQDGREILHGWMLSSFKKPCGPAGFQNRQSFRIDEKCFTDG
jgi:hypothetical protein